MTRVGAQPRRQLTHPDTADIQLLEVLHALSDPTRMVIVEALMSGDERLCGTFETDVAPATLSHHFRVLREAGVIRQRSEGTRRWTALRHGDLEDRFPGLIGPIVASYQRSARPE